MKFKEKTKTIFGNTIQNFNKCFNNSVVCNQSILFVKPLNCIFSQIFGHKSAKIQYFIKNPKLSCVFFLGIQNFKSFWHLVSKKYFENRFENRHFHINMSLKSIFFSFVAITRLNYNIFLKI